MFFLPHAGGSASFYFPVSAALAPRVEKLADGTELIASAVGFETSVEAIATGERVRVARRIRNSDRAFGAMLSGEIARRYGNEGLPDDTVVIA